VGERVIRMISIITDDDGMNFNLDALLALSNELNNWEILFLFYFVWIFDVIKGQFYFIFRRKGPIWRGLGSSEPQIY
jgi:hypothetical protein